MSELDFQIVSEAALEHTGESYVFELYHETAKQRRSDLRFARRVDVFNNTRLGHALVRRAGKSYACAEQIALPAADAGPTMSLAEALRKRRSTAAFIGQDIPIEVLATILRFANGTSGGSDSHEHPQRVIPSGGGLYPTELYILPLGLSALPLGAYHYDPREHRLGRFLVDPAEPVLARACFGGATITTASVAFAITAIFERQSIKYGERAYRFALLECGHLAQNLLLVGTALGLGTLPVGGFIDDELNSYLRVDGTREAVLYLVLMG
jgi:SagB-type dehydrogenase family enzyme